MGLPQVHTPLFPSRSVSSTHKNRLIDRQDAFSRPRRAEELYGDTFCIVTPSVIYLRTSNAELGSQITSRRNDFLKPVARYKIIDIFGRSILTQEGNEWKRHKRVVGPSFSEKSNRLVFEESLREVEAMLDVWVGREGNTKREIRVERLPIDMATLSFHVICAAGFGGTYCGSVFRCSCCAFLSITETLG
jgi:cytochrome P450